MKLIEPAQWAAKYFAEGSQPPESTLRGWMRDGVVSARKVGGKWFIDETAFLADGDALVEAVLRAG